MRTQGKLRLAIPTKDDCQLISDAGEDILQGPNRLENIRHIIECWNAVEEFGGDPELTNFYNRPLGKPWTPKG